MNFRQNLFVNRDTLGLTNVLAGWEPDYSPDHELEEEVARHLISDAISFEVDPFQFQSNINDVARLLDRLLTIRGEIWEIDAQRVNASIRYKYLISQVEAENQLTIVTADAANVDEIKLSCERKLAVAKSMVAELESRHGLNGGSLNFNDRLNKLRNLFCQDIESCHVRSAALVEGANKFYNQVPSRPTPGQLEYVSFSGASHLDDWVAWHRELCRKVESFQKEESFHEIVIPIGTKFLHEYYDIELGPTVSLRTSPKASRMHDDLPSFIKQVHGDFFFSLEDESLPEPGKALRSVPSCCGQGLIQELAVKVSLLSAAEYQQGWTFIIQVIPPGVEKPICLSSSPSSPQLNWVSSPNITNRPCKGTWKMRILSASKDDVSNENQASLAMLPIADIKLALRLWSGGYQV